MSSGNRNGTGDWARNATGYYVDEDDESEPGLDDVQTLFLACFATLIPLIIALVTAFGIRTLWTRCRHAKSVEDSLKEENPARPLHAHLLDGEKDTISTHLDVVGDDMGDMGQIRSNPTTNGSIITMTLKNNHLIVETEERTDIVQDSRETTMKYSPSARDGVFVVEVQQGVRSDALVHSPAERFSDEETLEECDDYVETVSPDDEDDDDESVASRPQPVMVAGVGVRSPDGRSPAASDDSFRPPYAYTDQQGYDAGRYGCAMAGDVDGGGGGESVILGALTASGGL